MTPLDEAHAAMAAAPEDDAPRLRFYERLADSEMFLLLEAEATDDTIAPRVFGLEEGPVVLLFDSEARLADFTGAPAPYAALPGRVVIRQLAGQGIGIGLNLGVAPSAFVLAAEAVNWLADMIDRVPSEVSAVPRSFSAPGGLPEVLLRALDSKLARAGALASSAFLAGVTYADGRIGHILALVGAEVGAEPALANAVNEGLAFSGVEAGELDVVFLSPDDPVLARMKPVALRFDLTQPDQPARAASAAPGSDPARPPILR